MQVLGYTKNGLGIELQTEVGKFYLGAVNDDIIRCVYTREEVIHPPSMLVVEQEETVALNVKEFEDELYLETQSTRLVVKKENSTFTWLDRQTGELLLKEAGKTLAKTDVIRYTTQGEEPIIDSVRTVDGERSFIRNLREKIDGHAYRGKLHFDWQEDEAIHGLGQFEEGIYNYRGHNQYLYQHNMRIPIPFMVSSKGYGIFMDCSSLMTFQDDFNGSYIFMDTIDQMDYYLIKGYTMDQIISGYRYLTGKAVMLPKWAFGYIQSKEAYKTADEFVAVAKKYRELKVPIDGLVQDWNTWEPGKWGQKTVDKSRYPDLAKMNNQIHQLNIHTMVSIWPNTNVGGENHTEFAKAGYLLEDNSTYDAFNLDARNMYWQQMEEELFSGGFDSWWCDSTEPFSGPDWSGEEKREPWERYQLVGGEHKKFLDPTKTNAYSLVHAQGIYENQRKVTEEKRVLNLTRSGYTGSQRYGTVLWSGDTFASWETYQQQIKEGLNFALSGMPYWTQDIGAFFTVGTAWQNRGCGQHTNPNPLWFWKGEFNEGVKDLGYKELYVRWLQYATFLPMFRAHGTDTPREIWAFGEPGDLYYDIIEKYIKLRYQLMPYLYSLAGGVWLEDKTIHRSLLFDFVSDETARGIWDQFMFGEAMMVCPVITPMHYLAESQKIQEEVKEVRSCYLPKGTNWFDYWTGESYEGGQWIEAATPLNTIPIFVKAGSIIPMMNGLEYATDTEGKPLEIHVYPGQDGSFTLYEDGNDNYEYEKGQYATIQLSWSEADQKITIGEVKGEYQGMPKERTFKIYMNGQKREDIKV